MATATRFGIFAGGLNERSTEMLNATTSVLMALGTAAARGAEIGAAAGIAYVAGKALYDGASSMFSDPATESGQAEAQPAQPETPAAGTERPGVRKVA